LQTTNDPRLPYTPKPFKCQHLEAPEILLPREVSQLKRRAFATSHLAKASTGQARAAHYRRKDAAVNELLKLGCAFIDGVDWQHDDPLIALWFLGGGQLHIPLSRVDLQAFKKIRAQLNGDLTPPRVSAA
jgi:hypothetical protein